MKYSPVLILTCNRVKHLEECIKSLAQNEWAENTDIYISVDFPPDDRYVDGWNKVKDYLSHGLNSYSFASINIIIQNYNLGPYKNGRYLINWVREKHDRFIITEDDNVFSKYYLKFVNQALERIENEDQIVAVCPYQSNKNVKNSAQIYTLRYFSSWGNACLVSDKLKQYSWINNDNILNFAVSIRKMFEFWKYFRGYFNTLVEGILYNHVNNFFEEDNRVAVIDVTINMYLCNYDYRALFPNVNYVKNNGGDGSGINSRMGDWSYDIDEEDVEMDFTQELKDGKPGDVGKEHNLRGHLRDTKVMFHYLVWLIFIRKIAKK